MAAAIEGRELGAAVLMVERSAIGGTCVNVGCVPSKFMLSATRHHANAAQNPFAGIATRAGKIDVPALADQRIKLVDHLRAHKYVDVAHQRGFEIVSGTGRFVSGTKVAIDGETFEPGAVVLATGARPAVPNVAGSSEVDFLTSTTALALTEVPQRLLVVGGGFVGLEMAQLFTRLGSEVTVIGAVAPRAEPELALGLTQALQAQGVTFVPGRLTGFAGPCQAITEGARVLFDRVLFAVGRSANTDQLDTTAGGIETDAAGAIVTDLNQRTTNSRVWAAGDVTTGPQFVYVAAQQGRIAARNALTGGGEQVDYRGLPSVLFTSPNMASAGLTQAEACSQGYSTNTVLLNLADIPRAIVDNATEGLIKLVVDLADRRLLGVHVLAPDAGELMLAATYAIKFGLSIDDVATTWAPYLTMSEGLRLAAQQFDHPGALSCCA